MDELNTLDSALPGFLRQAGAPPIVSVAKLHDRPRSAVRRLQLAGLWHGHEWFVAKQIIGQGAGPRFERELAALRLVASLNIEPPVAPAVEAWDASTRILLLKDLGDEGLATVLAGQNPLAARIALLDYAATLGRLHAATKLPARLHGCLDARLASKILRQHCTDFQQFCTATGCPADRGFKADVDQVEIVLSSAEPFQTLTHGDPCPDNERMGAAGLVFIDFETAGFNHALLDCAYFGMAFPTCWCAGAIPAEVLSEMQNSYRHALCTRVPEAADDAAFYRHLLHASARWLIDSGTLVPRARRTGENHFSRLLTADWSWGTATARQRMLYRLRAFLELAERAHDLSGIASTAERLYGCLASRWKDSATGLPHYPAFRAP